MDLHLPIHILLVSSHHRLDENMSQKGGQCGFLCDIDISLKITGLCIFERLQDTDTSLADN